MSAHFKKHNVNNTEDHIGVIGAVTGNLVEFNSDGLFADSNKKVADFSLVGHGHVAADISDFDTEVSNNVDVTANTGARHTHANKALLDTYTQLDTDLEDAVDKKHTQNTDTSLDFGQANQVTALELRAHLDNINAHDADEIDVDVTNFDGILSAADDTVQKALETIDNYSPSATTWGSITGTLSDQIDLQNALNGKSDVNHTHVEADITDLDKYTQLEVDNLLEAQDELSEMNDVVISGVLADNEVLAYDTTSGKWINQTASEANLSVVGHTHVASDITDFDTEVSNNTDVTANTGARHTQNTDTYLDFGNVNQVSASEIRNFIDSKAQPNGLASLGADGKIPQSQIPAIAITDVYVVANIVARDALVVQTGDVAKVSDAGSGYPQTYIYDGSIWIDIQETSDVISVNGQTGVVVLDTDDISEGTTNLYYTDARVSANTDVANNTANSHVQNTDWQLRSGLVEATTVGELKIKVFRQAAQPTLSADDVMAYWVDTDAGNQVFLMFRESAGNTLLVELA